MAWAVVEFLADKKTMGGELGHPLQELTLLRLEGRCSQLLRYQEIRDDIVFSGRSERVLKAATVVARMAGLPEDIRRGDPSRP